MSEPILEVQDLRKVYSSRRRGDVVAVDRVSFTVDRNEVVGLLGPNGAGKTTTIKCLCTLLRPTSGGISIEGVDVRAHPRAALRKIAAVLEGNRNVYWRLNPRENLEFFAGIQGIPMREIRPYIDELIELFDLRGKERTPARMLSRGMQQKLAVACALVKRTDILLLDEPTLGLDVETSYELRRILKQMAQSGERTILLSSHDMNVVQQICDRVIVINDGRIVTDDNVSNLLELFRARAYEFSISGRLHEAQQRKLREAFELIHIEPDTHRSSIRVELVDGSQFYHLIDMLRENGSVIESVDRRDPDLEEIFLRIVKGEK